MDNKRKWSHGFVTSIVVGGVLLLSLGGFLTWRMVRPMSIFVVTDEFALPIAETEVQGLPNLNAETCGTCHQTIYKEWKTSIHSKAWVDPLFQAYNRFDGYQQICLNCHTPMQNQQPDLVKGHEDSERFQPILEKNNSYDSNFRDEGVTCAVCHVKNGKIEGPFGSKISPHPSVQNPAFTTQGEVCKRCHLVKGDSWDTFLYQEGPCGTYEDLTEEMIAGKREDVGCYTCHMPAVKRPLFPGGEPREGRAHLWRGGHDPDMVKSALKITFEQDANSGYRFTLLNQGAGHRLPTGAPMRYLKVTLRAYDKEGKVLKEETHELRRNVIWRPFIVDLRDDRLEPGKPRTYLFEPDNPNLARVSASLSYHLMPEEEKKMIGAPQTERVSYNLYDKEILVKAKNN